MREWKPGDVATLPTGDRAVVDIDGYFVYGRREFENSRPGSINATRARPLVVIDPEDFEQVKRLMDLIDERYGAPGCGRYDAMAAALREFANPTPPKPDEPTGLGAVVEDTDGHLWVRASLEYPDRWRPTVGPANWRDWPAITAVRVLSEGVEVDR